MEQVFHVSRLVSEEPTKQITNYRWFPADYPIRLFVTQGRIRDRR